jgi:uncharacterized protein YpmB
MFFNRRLLVILLVMFLAMLVVMAYIFFRSDGHGRVTREADSPAAAARGQQLLSRVDALTNQHQYDAAKALLDSLRDADANPAVFLGDNALEQRFDTLRQRKFRERQTQ